jgi:hypothetical protein
MRLAWGLFALAILAVCGCGSSTQYGEVEGVVTVDGKPLSKAEVRFMPEPDGGSNVRAVGYTDASGRYSLKLDGGKPGIATGNYVVCVIDVMAKRPQSKQGKTQVVTQPRVAFEFGDTSQTPLRGYTVQEGKQTFDLAVKRSVR